MIKNIFQIVERIKQSKGFKSDGEVAEALKMTKTALSNHKARRTIPYEALSTFCERENISLDWLLTGEKPTEHIGLVKDSPPIYNIKDDDTLSEILKMLSDHPEDKKLVLKLLRGKKDIKEALEGFEIKKLIEGEG